MANGLCCDQIKGQGQRLNLIPRPVVESRGGVAVHKLHPGGSVEDR